jgi:hypothetical protein
LKCETRQRDERVSITFLGYPGAGGDFIWVSDGIASFLMFRRFMVEIVQLLSIPSLIRRDRKCAEAVVKVYRS